MKAQKIAPNKAGCRFALVERADGWSVWRECSNYVQGRIAKSWRYCAKGLSRQQAEALFARRLAGSQR